MTVLFRGIAVSFFVPEVRFELASPTPVCQKARQLPGGERAWWAHVEFTRINTTPTILRKKIEDLREAGASIQLRTHDPTKQPFSLVAQRLERIEVRCAPRR
jgi:hypothetical protein